MEEVAQEDGVALAESHSEASATNQALLPMEVDEEQAGNSCQDPFLPLAVSISSPNHSAVACGSRFYLVEYVIIRTMK